MSEDVSQGRKDKRRRSAAAPAWPPLPLEMATAPDPGRARIRVRVRHERDDAEASARVAPIAGFIIYPQAPLSEAEAAAELATIRAAMLAAAEDAYAAALEADLTGAEDAYAAALVAPEDAYAAALVAPEDDDLCLRRRYATAQAARAAGVRLIELLGYGDARHMPVALLFVDSWLTPALTALIAGASPQDVPAAPEPPPAEPPKYGRTELVAHTSPPVAVLERAVADAAAGREHFALIDGGRLLVHTRGKAGYQVAVDYAEPVASVDEALADIAEQAGLEAVFMVAAGVHHALEHEGEPVHADDVLLDIGWDRMRDGLRETRAEALKRVARTYSWLNGWSVIGETWGKFTDKDGRALDVSSDGPLFMATALNDAQGRLLGRPDVVGFTFRRGEFLARAAAYPHVLETFGTYRALARMPRRRTADAWTVSTGLALVQRWRELAPHSRVTRPGDDNTPTPHVQRMRRRYLLTQYPPSPSPEEVLYERDEETGRPDETRPRRKGKRDACAYWTKVLANLKAQGVIDEAVRRRLEGRPEKLPRRGWGKAWLDETLDARPPEGYGPAFLTLAERAETHKAKTGRAQRRRRPKGQGA